MANVVYNEYKENLITGAAALTAGTSAFGVILTTSGYTPTEGDTITEVVASEVSTTSFPDYSRKMLTGVTISKVEVGGDATGVDDYYKVDADDTAFGPTVTITASGAVIVKLDADNTLGTEGSSTGIHSVVTYVDFSGPKSSSNGDFTVVWNANGVLNYKQGS